MHKEISQQDFFREAQIEYIALKKKVWTYFHDTFLPTSRIDQYENEMLRFLKKEKNRLLLHSFVGQNPLLELKHVLQIFYFRERGEKVSLREMNPYLREYLNKDNIKIFNKPQFNGKAVLEQLNDLLIHRIKLPKSGPEEVIRSWLPQQFEKALNNIPKQILKEEGFGKVIRVMGGVFLFALSELKNNMSDKEVHDKIEIALKGGYYYGMFYPLIDDLLDNSHVFSSRQKIELMDLLNHWIIGDYSLKNVLKSNSSMKLLEEIFKEFHKLFPLEDNPQLYKAALMLHFSQLEDANKNFQTQYSIQDLFVPIIIKASYTRVVGAAISGTRIDNKLHKHMIETGLMYQLSDDFRDWGNDTKNKLFTPFTYYQYGPSKQPINPVSLFLSIYRVYFLKFESDPLFVKLMAKKLSVTIQRFNDKNTPKETQADFWKIINKNKEIGKLIAHINKSKYRILDPDTDFTKPIDEIINRGI